ncbi:MAG: ribonuclease J [Anaerolineae bacterium]|nr:ribonuclease J [Anaerolineae bacterium]
MSIDRTLFLIPLGGLGEVGKNMMVLEYDRQIIIIDAGLMFPENDMLGIDLVIPDFGYLLDKKDQVKAIVLTHGHEDHIGALSYLLREINAPVYSTLLTRGLAEIKLKQHHLLAQVEFHTVEAGDRLSIGPFEIEFFAVNHSIPDCVGLAIDTPVGLIVHSGDYKFDYTPVDGQPTDFAKLASFGERNVLALLSDSTNAEHPGFTPSERLIEEAFDAVFRRAEGRVIVGTFASLISRIQQVIRCAVRHNRKVAIAGRTMADNVSMAQKLGYIDVPPHALLPLNDIGRLPANEIVILATGTQGEPAAALAKMATQRHRHINIQAGDTVIMSSHTIPGNEELVHRNINRLFQRGAQVVYHPIAPVHVSGHASQEEQKLLINLIRPHFLVPIHGELRHLKAQARLAFELGFAPENVLVVENGYRLQFTEDRVAIGERVPGGYVFVDGSGIGDVGPVLMREREQLARDGFVVVLVPPFVDGQSHGVPQIITRGFVFQPDAQDLFEQVTEQVIAFLTDNPPEATDKFATSLRRHLEAYLYQETKRHPIVIPVLSDFNFA